MPEDVATRISDSADLMLFSRCCIKLKKIEREVFGTMVSQSVMACACDDPEEFDEKYAHLFYEPHSDHQDSIVPHIVADLKDVRTLIARVVHHEAKRLLYKKYKEVKEPFCNTEQAQAYQLAQSFNVKK